VTTVIAVIKKIRAFKYSAKSGSKFHISVGHMTVMAKVTFFGAAELKKIGSQAGLASAAEGDRDKKHFSLTGDEVRDIPKMGFLWDKDYVYQDEMMGRDLDDITTSTTTDTSSSSSSGTGQDGRGSRKRFLPQYALLQLEQPVLCPLHCLIIGSRLDASTHSQSCRIGFYGSVVEILRDGDVGRIRIYKEKVKMGRIHRLGERVGGGSSGGNVYYDVTGQGLFKKETDISPFIGMKMESEKGEMGVLDSAFGRTGKFKAVFRDGLHEPKVNDCLYLRFQKYIYGDNKKMLQLDIDRPRPQLPPPPEDPPMASSLTPRTAPPQSSAEIEDSLVEAVEANITVSDDSGHDASEATSEFVTRDGEVDLIKPGDLAIVKGLFTIEEDSRRYVGMKVVGEGEVEGCIIGPFGKGGKAKVQFNTSFGGGLRSKVTLYIPKDFK